MPNSRQLPTIAVTLGDPSGIGPETVAAACSDPRVRGACAPVALGRPETLERAIDLIDAPLRVERIDSPDQLDASSALDPATLICLPVGDGASAAASCSAEGAAAGQAAYDAVVQAARGALAGHFDAVATAPLSKAALHAAGHAYPGHTELLAELCSVDDFAMMLYLSANELPSCRAGLGVVHTTLHCSMRNALATLSEDAILAKIRLAHAAMSEGFGIASPKIGVCALNPHAGESGLFGDEEAQLIAPAVEGARNAGVDATGPLPADTLMVRSAAGEFDAVVAMYHDQGHIALKLLGMHRAVNITLGLPIIRTSAAHGTAHDLAWQGKADSAGMIEAILAAAQLADQGFRFHVSVG